MGHPYTIIAAGCTSGSQLDMNQLQHHIVLALVLGFCGICGVLARIGLTDLTSFQGDLGGLVWANFAGSLVMGFTASNSFLYGDVLDNEDEIPKYQSAGEIRLYIALTTGFCGSLTDFSVFIKQLFYLSANRRLSLAYDYANPGYGVMMFLAYAIETMSVSVTGFLIGKTIARLCEAYERKLPFAKWESTIEFILGSLGLAAWIASIGLFVADPTSATRHYTGPILFAPFGVYARHYLCRYLNRRSKKFLIGTFLSNVCATIILSLLLILQTGQSPHSSVAIVTSPLCCQIINGLIEGFCGNFSTISSFVSELVDVLYPANALVYGTTTILTSYASMVLIYGTYTWVHGNSPPTC
uniref:ARAD1D23958p n=1 Tax=Blastobotrys adeninivorans TaxID=409370 RepID=A0A060TAZ2_BLAAD